MKFIGVNKSDNHEIANYSFFHIVDSALVNNGKPFFIPNFARQFEGRLCIAVRLCRLGRCISERYAYRYFDAVGIACRFEAKDLREKFVSLNRPFDMATSFDGAVNISNCIMLNTVDSSLISASLSVNEIIVQKIEENNIIDLASKLIAAYSKYSTVRQGDYLLIDTEDIPFVATIDNHIDGYINEQHLLSFNIK